jgi:tetratricopeptide (TPR) repeat protein
LILNNLALAQLRVGKYDDAYKNFARAGGAFNAHMNVASLLMRVGREERAIEHLEDARKINPDSTRVLSQLAALYDQTGRKDRADEARQALHVLDERNSHVAVAGGQ